MELSYLTTQVFKLFRTGLSFIDGSKVLLQYLLHIFIRYVHTFSSVSNFYT